MEGYKEYKSSKLNWIGDIPKHWDLVSFKRGINYSVGFTPATSNPEFYDSPDYNWATIADLNSKIIFDTKNKLSRKGIESSGKKPVKKGSLLYSFKLSVGKVSFAGEEMYTNEAILAIESNERNCVAFLYYLLPALLKYNANHNIYGAEIFNQEVINNSKIPLPSLEEQQKIAEYLDYKTAIIDEIIAKKQKLIAALDEKKKSIINDIVTGKKVWNGSEFSTPTQVKDSGIQWLGQIPVHWEVYKLKYILNLKSGKTLNAESISDEGEYPVFGGNGIRGFYTEYNTVGIYPLIGRQGALCGNINYSEGKFWATEHALVVRLKKEGNLNFFGELLRVMNLNQYSVASAQPGLSVENLNELSLNIPPLEEQNNIIFYINKLNLEYNKISDKLNTQIEKIKEYRQAVIAETVTGKTDVRHWTIPNN